jgi:hypothetical protein
MARPQLAVYDGIKIPRTRENEDRYREKTPCKRFPKYVYGKPGAASLIHKVAYADMCWYAFGYDYLYRLQSPIIWAHTVCGSCWRISEAGVKFEEATK